MDRRRRAARTVALMSLFSMTDTQENAPIASFDGDGSDLVSLIVGIDPVQTGNGDPSPDNVRPISGWTEAKVTRTGANLGIVKNLYVGGGSGLAIGNEGVLVCFSAVKGQTYSISGSSGNRINLYKFRGNMEDIKAGASMSVSAGSGGLPYVITADETCIYCYYRNSTWSDTIANTMMVSIGSTATAYEPYVGTTYPIPLGTTVYGGTLDVTTGKLTVDRANIASYNGEPLPSTWISDRDVYAVGTTPTTGAQVVYKLATPIVYDLTPTQVTTLIGTNNIWADTGDIKYIEYNI